MSQFTNLLCWIHRPVGFDGKRKFILLTVVFWLYSSYILSTSAVALQTDHLAEIRSCDQPGRSIRARLIPMINEIISNVDINDISSIQKFFSSKMRFVGTEPDSDIKIYESETEPLYTQGIIVHHGNIRNNFFYQTSDRPIFTQMDFSASVDIILFNPVGKQCANLYVKDLQKGLRKSEFEYTLTVIATDISIYSSVRWFYNSTIKDRPVCAVWEYYSDGEIQEISLYQ